jgi:hypothetical protein
MKKGGGDGAPPPPNGALLLRWAQNAAWLTLNSRWHKWRRLRARPRAGRGRRRWRRRGRRGSAPTGAARARRSGRRARSRRWRTRRSSTRAAGRAGEVEIAIRHGRDGLGRGRADGDAGQGQGRGRDGGEGEEGRTHFHHTSSCSGRGVGRWVSGNRGPCGSAGDLRRTGRCTGHRALPASFASCFRPSCARFRPMRVPFDEARRPLDQGRTANRPPVINPPPLSPIGTPRNREGRGRRGSTIRASEASFRAESGHGRWAFRSRALIRRCRGSRPRRMGAAGAADPRRLLRSGHFGLDAADDADPRRDPGVHRALVPPSLAMTNNAAPGTPSWSATRRRSPMPRSRSRAARCSRPPMPMSSPAARRSTRCAPRIASPRRSITRRARRARTASAPSPRSCSTGSATRLSRRASAASSTRATLRPAAAASSPSPATARWRAAAPAPPGRARSGSPPRRSAGYVYAPVGLATHYHTTAIHPWWAPQAGQGGDDRRPYLLPAAGPGRRAGRLRRCDYSGNEPLPHPTMIIRRRARWARPSGLSARRAPASTRCRRRGGPAPPPPTSRSRFALGGEQPAGFERPRGTCAVRAMAHGCARGGDRAVS